MNKLTPQQNFVHFHAHTHISLQDALPSPTAYAMKAREMGFPAAAITDHGRMGGCVEFASACRKPHEKYAPIKPILGCCLPGQLIYTIEGMKPIEDIEVGDLVLTHNGRYRKVLSTMTRHYDGTLYGLNAAQSNLVWVTDEHPVMVVNDLHHDWRNGVGYSWVRADALVAGRKDSRECIDSWKSYVVFPQLKTLPELQKGEDAPWTVNILDYLDPEVYLDQDGKVHKKKYYNKWDRSITFDIPTQILITDDFAWLLGVYVAEGSVQRDGLGRETSAVFTLNNNTEQHMAERVQSAIERIFGLKSTIKNRPDKNIVEVMCSSTVFARFLALACGSGCANKRIPPLVYSFLPGNIDAFIKGVVDGDGNYEMSSTQITFRMKSKHVVYGLRLLIAGSGRFGKATMREEGDNKVVYTLCWSEEAKRRKVHTNELGVIMPLKEITTKHYSGPVHNFEVEDDNSYVTDFVLHNCELYTCEDRFNMQNMVLPDGTKRRPKHNHLTVLAKNETGYRNLLKISSQAATESFYYDPRSDEKLIWEHGDGLIVGTGCLGSAVNQAILNGEVETAEKIMRRFIDRFGDDYVVEVQFHKIAAQKEVIKQLVPLAKKLGRTIIASNDVHYLDATDWETHEVLIQMRDLSDNRKSKVGGKKEAYGTHQFYLKTEQEMAEIFGIMPEAVSNTILLADRVEDFLKLDVPHLLPHALIPEQDSEFRKFWRDKLPYHKANEAFLYYMAWNGLQQLGLHESVEYKKRLFTELEQICNMGVVDYFLNQREFVEFMRSTNILYGIRGSGVGSLVNYCLKVSTVDPVRWKLLFERFLNPGRGNQYKIDLSCYPVKEWLDQNGKQDQIIAVKRLRALFKEKQKLDEFRAYAPAMAKEVWVLENQGLATYICDIADQRMTTKENEANLWSAYFLGITNECPQGELIVSRVATLPDVDTDIEDRRRKEVIDWTRQRFGEDHVAMIGTYGTYQLKAAVSNTLKVTKEFVERYGDDVPKEAIVVSKSIPFRAAGGLTLEEAMGESPEFAKYVRRYPKAMKIASQLVGTISHYGVHAGGVLISREPISYSSPVECARKKGEDKVIYSAFDMASVERVGLVKYDFLGLKTYHMISRALDYIAKRHPEIGRIDLETINLEDQRVFRLFTQGQTDSVFQFASEGMKKALRDVRADNMEDLIAIVALYRPGPLDYIPAYAEGKRNPRALRYADPLIEKHMGVTYGIMVYQEQAMFMAYDMGLDWNEVDKLRKSISKKDPIEFEKVRKLLKERAMSRGFKEQVVDEVLKLMEKFGGYAFNRSHACAYAVLAYYTAYLRVHYPAEWLAACMHVDRDNKEQLAIYEYEARQCGIKVQKPNVNQSTLETEVTAAGNIALPLTSVKGVGDMALGIAVNQPYENLKDMVVRARPNRGMVESLADEGALDCFPELRGKDLEETMSYYDRLVEQRNQEEKEAARLAKQRFRVISPFSSGEKRTDNDDGAREERPKKPIREVGKIRGVRPIDFGNAFTKDFL